MGFSQGCETPGGLPGIAEIEAAARRLAGEAVVTPLLRSHALDALLGSRFLIKPETLQRTGSFKFRGAYNKIRRLIETGRRPDSVVAYSSGNHAQGVAAAARLLGVPAVIVMPADAPRIKLESTRAHGAEILTYDRYRESRERVAEAIAAERKAALVRPFDDPDIIAGQGTVGLELAQQAAALDIAIDVVLVPCSGGGLVSGCATALASRSPGTRVHSVEPEHFDDTARSLAAGRRLANAGTARSFCDALLSPQPGELTFQINRRLLAGGLGVSDAEVAAAMRYAFETLKLVIEPGGAVALAAALSGKIDCRGRTVAIVCSGGNVDPATFGRAISREA